MRNNLEIGDITNANIQQLRVVNVATLPVTYSKQVHYYNLLPLLVDNYCKIHLSFMVIFYPKTLLVSTL